MSSSNDPGASAAAVPPMIETTTTSPDGSSVYMSENVRPDGSKSVVVERTYPSGNRRSVEATMDHPSAFSPPPPPLVAPPPVPSTVAAAAVPDLRGREVSTTTWQNGNSAVTMVLLYSDLTRDVIEEKTRPDAPKVLTETKCSPGVDFGGGNGGGGPATGGDTGMPATSMPPSGTDVPGRARYEASGPSQSDYFHDRGAPAAAPPPPEAEPEFADEPPSAGRLSDGPGPSESPRDVDHNARPSFWSRRRNRIAAGVLYFLVVIGTVLGVLFGTGTISTGSAVAPNEGLVAPPDEEQSSPPTPSPVDAPTPLPVKPSSSTPSPVPPPEENSSTLAASSFVVVWGGYVNEGWGCDQPTPGLRISCGPGGSARLLAEANDTEGACRELPPPAAGTIECSHGAGAGAGSVAGYACAGSSRPALSTFVEIVPDPSVSCEMGGTAAHLLYLAVNCPGDGPLDYNSVACGPSDAAREDNVGDTFCTVVGECQAGAACNLLVGDLTASVAESNITDDCLWDLMEEEEEEDGEEVGDAPTAPPTLRPLTLPLPMPTRAPTNQPAPEPTHEPGPPSPGPVPLTAPPTLRPSTLPSPMPTHAPTIQPAPEPTPEPGPPSPGPVPLTAPPTLRPSTLPLPMPTHAPTIQAAPEPTPEPGPPSPVPMPTAAPSSANSPILAAAYIVEWSGLNDGNCAVPSSSVSVTCGSGGTPVLLEDSGTARCITLPGVIICSAFDGETSLSLSYMCLGQKAPAWTTRAQVLTDSSVSCASDGMAADFLYLARDCPDAEFDDYNSMVCNPPETASPYTVGNDYCFAMDSCLVESGCVGLSIPPVSAYVPESAIETACLYEQ